MRVFHRTGQTLVLRDAPDKAARAFGGCLAIAGVAPIVEAVRTGSSSGATIVEQWVLLAAGAFAIAGGSALLFLLRTTTCMVDRAAGTLRVSYENAFGSDGWGCYLSSLADVVLEPQFGADGHALYRIALVSASGRRIPLTSYSSAGERAQMPAVAALRQFLPVNAGRRERTSVRPANLDRGQWRRVARFLYWSAACLLLLGGGAGWMIWTEARAGHAYQRVSVTVLTTRLETRVEAGSVTRRPVVVYRYNVGGRVYTSERVTQNDEWRSGKWAFEIVNRFVPGTRYTAFYDSADPGTAFLFKPRDGARYALAVVPLLGLVLVARAIRDWRKHAPPDALRPTAAKGLVFLPT